MSCRETVLVSCQIRAEAAQRNHFQKLNSMYQLDTSLSARDCHCAYCKLRFAVRGKGMRRALERHLSMYG